MRPTGPSVWRPSARMILTSERWVPDESRRKVLNPTAVPDLADALAWAEGEVRRLAEIANGAGFYVAAPRITLPSADQHFMGVSVSATEPESEQP